MLTGWEVKGDIVADILLAVTESCTNVIRHGYGTTITGDLSLHITRTGQAIEITIQDTAPVFIPAQLPPAQPQILTEGQYGLFLIHTLMDEVSYEHFGPRGNCTRLVKYNALRPQES
jgi:serine/threonine-protein kinase RsbW